MRDTAGSRLTRQSIVLTSSKPIKGTMSAHLVIRHDSLLVYRGTLRLHSRGLSVAAFRRRPLLETRSCAVPKFGDYKWSPSHVSHAMNPSPSSGDGGCSSRRSGMPFPAANYLLLLRSLQLGTTHGEEYPNRERKGQRKRYLYLRLLNVCWVYYPWGVSS